MDAIGISPDSPRDQKRFDEENRLGFPLLSDPDHSVAESYGVWAERTMYGKTSHGIKRSCFLVDESGKVLQPWYGIRPDETIPKAMEALAKL